MRVTLGIATVVASTAVLGCAEGTTAPSAETRVEIRRHGAEQKVTGGYQVTTASGERQRFAFNAHRASDGSVKGEYQWINWTAGVSMHGDVTCLVVVGNEARIGGTIERSDIPGTAGSGEAVWRLADNGEGRGAPPDQSSLMRIGNQGTADFQCQTGWFDPLFNVDRGNVQVHR